MKRSIPGLFRSNSGAVAPTVALSLFGLIAAGGIAFDYARMATMDTELQNAADQAALAAAGQLDGQAGACARAAAAASALLANYTLLANDSHADGSSVTITNESACDASGNVQFYQSYDAVTDTPGLEATTDEDAKVVIVSVTPRQAVFALTPIVAAFNSGDIGAQAVAGLSSSVCKVPPVMICNPLETPGNTDFNVAPYIGDGLRLTAVGNGPGGWVPGVFGYLDSSGGDGGADDLKKAVGWDIAPGTCLSGSGVETKPGANASVPDSLNTRFDMFDTNSCLAGGTCSPAYNSVKDLKRRANASGANSCKPTQTGNPQGWYLPDGYYGHTLPATATALTNAQAEGLSAMGHPRDMCHAVSTDGTCADGRIGNGVWDANAYFRRNYIRAATLTRWSSTDWPANTGLSLSVPRTVPGPNPGDPPQLNPAYASRYNVYLWEIENSGDTVDGVVVLGANPAGAVGTQLVSYGQPQCGTPTATIPDRRVITAAVVNCAANGVTGNKPNIPVEKWISLFLVEPSLNRSRTNAGDIYVEVIGENLAGGNDPVRRDVPYLIK